MGLGRKPVGISSEIETLTGARGGFFLEGVASGKRSQIDQDVSCPPSGWETLSHA